MIDTIFNFGNGVVLVRINDTNCLFQTQQTSGGFAPIDSLKLSKQGSIKEHPDLKDNKDWEDETRRRFKEKLKSLPSETERMKYIIKDLKKHGYTATHWKKSGCRPVKLK